MSRSEDHLPGQITCWDYPGSRFDDGTRWDAYLLKEQARHAAKGIKTQILKQPVVRHKRGKSYPDFRMTLVRERV